jgi:hypothetical protein
MSASLNASIVFGFELPHDSSERVFYADDVDNGYEGFDVAVCPGKGFRDDDRYFIGLKCEDFWTPAQIAAIDMEALRKSLIQVLQKKGYKTDFINSHCKFGLHLAAGIR